MNTRFLIAILALVACLSACGGRNEPPEVLVVSLAAEPLTLDPRLALDAASSRANQLIYPGLLRLDDAGRPAPDLAQSWEVDPTGTVYTLKLRPGLRFHDGRALTSRDAAFTLRSVLDPELASPKRADLELLEEIAAPDDLTLVLTLKEPDAPFPVALTLGVVPEGSGAELGQNPVGAGPYRLTGRAAGHRLEFTAFEGYHRGTPLTQKLVLKVSPDDTTRALELIKGEVDLVLNGLNLEMLPLLAREDGLRELENPSSNYAYLAFNLRHPPLDNILVRQAVARALDVPAMIRFLLRGRALPARGMLPPGHWAYNGHVRVYPHDPEAARRLLDRAGLPSGPDGVRLRLLYKTTVNPASLEKASVIQEQLRQVGIDLEIRSLEWSAFFADIRGGNFQLCSLEWVGIADPDILRQVFNSRSLPPDGANRGGYSNPEVDRLTEAARRNPDPAERARLYGRVQEILARDLPYVSLWHPRHVVVQGMGWTPFHLTPDPDFALMAEMGRVGECCNKGGSK